jgi:hypothetical protein
MLLADSNDPHLVGGSSGLQAGSFDPSTDIVKIFF